MRPRRQPDTSGASMMSLPEVDENAEKFELLNHSVRPDDQHPHPPPSHGTGFGRRVSDKSWILILSASALVPIALGIMFLFSLRLDAPHGIISGRTFTRPQDEGLNAYIGIWHISLSPLLVSSIASSIIGDLGILAMSLVAFPVAYLWLQASRSDSSSIPPPYQFFLISEFISHSSPFALIRFLAYLFRRRGSSTASRRSSQRSPIVTILWITAAAASILLMLSTAIKILDIVLHDQLSSTLLYRNVSTTVLGSAYVSPLCDATNVTSCAILPRAREANLGGQNQSATFGVYATPYDPTTNVSYTFAGSTESDSSITFTGKTVAMGTECALLYPECKGNAPYTSQQCNAYKDPYTPLGQAIPVFIVNNDDPIVVLQSFTLYEDPLVTATRNPLWIEGFMCFSYFDEVYAGYDQLNGTVFAPFVGNTEYTQENLFPGVYCFIYHCWATIYDGTYTLSHGVAELSKSSLVQAPPETVLAVSSSIPNWNTSYSQSAHYIDTALHVDINTAANTFVNDTTRFSVAVAQSLSNRILGWSSGAITINETAANRTEAILAVSIPLVTAGTITGLHFFYACLILAFAMTSMFLPSEYHTAIPLDDNQQRYEGEALPQERGADVDGKVDSKQNEAFSSPPSPPIQAEISNLPFLAHPPLVSDLIVAQRRLSDTSTLVHEIVIRHDQLSSIDGRALIARPNGSSPLLRESPTRASSALMRPSSSPSAPFSSSAPSTCPDERIPHRRTGSGYVQLDLVPATSSRKSPSEFSTTDDSHPSIISHTSTMRARRALLHSSGSMNDLKDVERNDSGGVVRVGIMPDEDGPLRLHVLHQH